MCRRALFHVCLMTALALAAQAAEPVGYWPFDGDLADAVGLENGTFSGGSPVYVAGQAGQAIQFDGADDCVIVKGINFDAYTMTAWVKPAKRTAASIVARSDASGPGKSWSHQMRISSTGVFEHYLWDGASKSALGTTPVEPGEWYFIAVRATNRVSMELFVNGMKEAITAINTFWNGGDRYHIGSNSGNSMGWFQGIVDEVRIYNGELTDDEIGNLMWSIFRSSFSPVPSDATVDVTRDVTLGWAAGMWADTHDVYFGATFDDVNEATRDNPMGVLLSQGQNETTYDPAVAIEFGKTYYWRVDEVNAAPDYTIFPGRVWSFTVEPFACALAGSSITATASSAKNAAEGPENVINGSGLAAGDLHSVAVADMWRTTSGDTAPWIQFAFDGPFMLHEMLVWNHNSELELDLGVGIREAKVEYSLDGTDWTTLGTVEFAQATAVAGYAANTTVAFDGAVAQYVKVTPINNWGGVLPQYGLSEVRFLYVPVLAREPEPADGAVGVSVNPVLSWRSGREAATHNVYLGTDPETVNLLNGVNQAGYDLDGLDLGTTYYWRIDEANEAEATGLWEGHTWSFTTTEFLVVDDFESYTDDESAGETIFQTWIDGLTNGTGSFVGYNKSNGGTFGEIDIVRSGDQSMPLFYDNTSAAVSETTMSLSQDWTASAVQSLSLYFYGDPNNSGGQLYLKINSKKVAYTGEATDIKRALWRPWNIDLTTVGVDVSKVTKLTIGVEGTGTTGVVYIDDIRLYAQPVEVITPVQPADANMLAHFTFDGNLMDSSGNGANGEEHGGPTYAAGMNGQAIEFDGANDYVNVILDVPENGCTTAFWFKTTNGNCGLFGVVQKLLGDGGWDRQIYLTNGQVAAMIYSQETITAQVNVADGEWHHVAHMYGDAIGGQDLYVDGMVQAHGSKAQSDFGWQDGVHFGWSTSASSDYFAGMLDDAYIYGRTLSAAEIAWLAGGKTVAKPF